MRRSTDRLIALQFLAVAVPIAFVLLAQMVADARRATALEHSRPLRTRRAPTIALSPTGLRMRLTPVRSAGSPPKP